MKTLISKIESLVPAHFQLALFIMLLLFVSCFLGACTDKCEVKNETYQRIFIFCFGREYAFAHEKHNGKQQGGHQPWVREVRKNIG